MSNQDAETNKVTRTNQEKKVYVRFAAMIATSTAIMYAVMYVNTYQLSHVSLSETRLFMALLMGSTMAIVMLGFMLGMYKNMKVNVGIIISSVALFILSTFLVRSQNTVQDASYMSAMIPHHSIAILTSENSDIKDPRVCELAVEIVKAQKREIAEMKWLLDDIAKNGTASNAEEAQRRSVPEFEGDSIRQCSS